MHRWFRFCALIALMAFAQRPGALAQSTNEVPVSKHQLKPTAAQVVQHGMDEQNKRLDQLTAQVTALVETQTKQLEEQAKTLQALMEKADLQGKQIETLNADLERLNTALLARQGGTAEPAASRPSVQTAQPTAGAETAASLPAVKAEPATPDGVAADGSPIHVVKRGETLTTIARAHGTSVSELLRINKIEDERKLQIGQTLTLPKGASAAPQATPSSTPQSNPQTTP